MESKVMRKFLGWCSVINMIFLLFSWLLFIVAHDFIYHFWEGYHNLTIETFDAIYISIIGIYKILIIGFMIIPYFVLRIIDSKK